MSTIDQILIAFGGPSVLLIVLAFLARSLLQTWLTKDIKKFESDLRNAADYKLEHLKQELKFKGDASIEQLRSELQQVALEHQVRFSNLHEKRPAVVAELYKHLVEAFWDGERFVFQMGQHKRDEEYDATQKRIIDFYVFVETNRIYLPEHICELLASFVESLSRLMKKAFGDRLPHGRGSVNTCKHAVAILSRAREQAVYCLFQRPVRKPVIDVWVYGGIDYPNEQTLRERKEAFMTAYEEFKNDIPEARKALANEFRKLLGVENSYSQK